jgi:hypothetical protein
MGATSREIVSGHALDATLDAFEAVYTRVLTPAATRLTAAA